MMLLGYAKNKSNISILILDPQSQFYLDDKNLLPSNKSLKDEIKKTMNYEKYKILSDIRLPDDDTELFADLLLNNDFIRQAFRLFTIEKMELAAESIARYMEGRIAHNSFRLSSVPDKIKLLKDMLERFITPNGTKEEKEFSSYIMDIYSPKEYRNKLVRRISYLKENIEKDKNLTSKMEFHFGFVFLEKRG